MTEADADESERVKDAALEWAKARELEPVWPTGVSWIGTEIVYL